jgi:hypothetical protein
MFLQALALTMAAFALYFATRAPGLLWGDDAQLQRLAILDKVAQGPRSYALWSAVAHPFTLLPFGDPAGRVTLACGVFAALAVGVMFVVLRETKCPPWIAAVGATALAVSHSFWLHAVRTEIYSLLALTLALATATLVAAHNRPHNRPLLLLGLALIIVAFLAHPLAVTFVPGFVVLLVGTRPRDRYVVPALVVTGLVLVAFVIQRSSTLGGTGFSASEFVGGLLQVRGRSFVLWAGLLVYQFLLLTPLAVPGLVATWRRDRALGAFTVLAFAGPISFGFAFPVKDFFVFFIPSYLIFVIWIAQGIVVLARRLGDPALLRPALLVAALLPIAVYAAVPPLLERANVSLPIRTIPHRDNLRFFLDPPLNGEDSARRYGEEAFAVLPPNAAVLGDWTPYMVLRYLQEVDGKRPDLVFAELFVPGGQAQWLREQSRTRPVFLAAYSDYYDLANIERDFTIEPVGPVFRLVPRPAARSAPR